MNHKENDIVFPGEILCTYEEYIPLNCTYIEDGYVKSSIRGKLIIDNVNKTISVGSNNAPRQIMEGNLVIGYITEVKSRKALVTIKKIVGNERELIVAYKGYIHISKARDGYISSMHKLFKIGDIVIARVFTKLSPDYLELTTMDDELGVIKAMCVNCRKFMKLNKDNKLVCECGKIDSRKLSNNYGGL